MISKKFLSPLELQIATSLANPSIGFISLGAKSGGIYQKIGTTETKLVSSTDVIPVTSGGLNKIGVTSNSMLYASSADAYSEVTTSSFGRSLLNATSGTMFTGLNSQYLGGNLASAFATAAQGVLADGALPASAFSASGILNLIKIVDGAGSGLDADLLDGQSSAYYATATHKYHSFSNGQYYFDGYDQANYFRLFTENAAFDTVRFCSIPTVEYFDGTNWVTWVGGDSVIKILLDGREDTNVNIDHTHKQFRFTVNRNSGWSLTALIILQGAWTALTYPGIIVTTEANVSSVWTLRDTCLFDSAHTSGTHGTHVKVNTSMHDGISNYRVTVDITDWTDSGSYVTIPLKRFMILSNFSGLSINPWTWDYTKKVTFTNLNLTGQLASTVLELDASKNVIGATKATGYNLALSTTATDIKMNGTQSLGSLSTLARADHIHPSDTSKASLSGATFTGAISGTSASFSSTVQATGFKIGANDINTANTLTNVAYKNQNNNFSVGQTITGNSTVWGTFMISSTLDVQSTLSHRSNITVLNKANNGFVTWATRDITGTEAKLNFTNIGSIAATSFVQTGGTSTQFLKADGSVDSNGYGLLDGNTGQQWEGIHLYRTIIVDHIESTMGGAAMGYNAITQDYGAALGDDTNSYDGGACGYHAITRSGGSIGQYTYSYLGGSIGSHAISGNGFSGGAGAWCVIDGDVNNLNITNLADAIQLGTGNNTVAGTLQVYGHRIMNADGSLNGSAANLTSFPTLNQSTTGNAATATKLAATKSIWGQNFDGSGNVSGAISGITTLSMTGALSGATTGSFSTGRITLDWNGGKSGIGLATTTTAEGGWSRRYGFYKFSDGTLLGGFGGYGGVNFISSLWIGNEYNDFIVSFDTTTKVANFTGTINASAGTFSNVGALGQIRVKGYTATTGVTLESGSGGTAYLWNYENAGLQLGTNNATCLSFTASGIATFVSNLYAGSLIRSLGTTGASLFEARNDSGDFYVGIDDSSGAGLMAAGQSTSYARVLNTNSAYPLILGVNNNKVLTLVNGGAATFVGTVTATNFIMPSDKRLKTNIQSISLQPINIDYKEFEMNSVLGEKRYGVIAQELQKTNPELVCTDDKGYLSVKYIDLLIREVASLKQRVKELEEN